MHTVVARDADHAPQPSTLCSAMWRSAGSRRRGGVAARVGQGGKEVHHARPPGREQRRQPGRQALRAQAQNVRYCELIPGHKQGYCWCGAGRGLSQGRGGQESHTGTPSGPGSSAALLCIPRSFTGSNICVYSSTCPASPTSALHMLQASQHGFGRPAADDATQTDDCTQML